MKKFLALLLCTVCLFSGCVQKAKGGYKHPKFKTEYTIEEHIARIEERTKERFEEEIASGELVSYSVDIVYAFYDNDPEYFLVEIEYANEWENLIDENLPEYGTYTTKYKHLIGYIENDMYLVGIKGYDSGTNELPFMDGKSSYSLYEQRYERKYYGAGVQGVLVNGKIVKTADWSCLEYGNVQFHSHKDKGCPIGEIIEEDLYRNYMLSNFKLFIQDY